VEYLAQHIESLVFATDDPISVKEIQKTLEAVFDSPFKEEEIEAALRQLRERYQQDGYAIEIAEMAGGYQFLTKPAYHNTVGVYLKQTTRKRLSRAALETLSIIAYKQPVTKTEMEKIRGVSCDYSIQKLLDKDLVAIIGRSDGPGRPLFYGTSDKFMDYFGLKSLDDLPKPKDFKVPGNQIGEKAPIEEAVSRDEEE
jgi:segregation and condensation protein B